MRQAPVNHLALRDIRDAVQGAMGTLGILNDDNVKTLRAAS